MYHTREKKINTLVPLDRVKTKFTIHSTKFSNEKVKNVVTTKYL